MRSVLTPDDLRKGELAQVGWHPAIIHDYTEDEAGQDAKNPGSTNCIFHFKIIDGPDKGKTVKGLFNEFALGFGKNLYPVFFGPPDPIKGYTADQLNSDSFRAQVGKKVDIYIKRSKSNKGNEYNDVADFRPPVAA